MNHNMTDAELQAALQEAGTKLEHTTNEAAAELEALQAEQQRRAEAARAQHEQTRTAWAEWFLDGGGFTKLKQQQNAEEQEAREHFINLIADSPIGQAAARFYAATEARQHVYDLREEASQILEREFNPVILQNRTDLTAEILTTIEKRARNIAADHWDDLKATQTQPLPEWDNNTHEPTGRTETYTVAGPDDYGKPVRMTHNIATGESEVIDEEFLAWQKEQPVEDPLEPPAWAHHHILTEH